MKFTVIVSKEYPNGICAIVELLSLYEITYSSKFEESKIIFVIKGEDNEGYQQYRLVEMAFQGNYPQKDCVDGNLTFEVK
jgi:hypothetical protein